MADILIKNMEMPRGDDIISAYIHSDGSVSYVYVNEDRPSVTTAVALPPHGDLIEGEKVLKVLDAVLDNKEFIKIRQTLIDAVPIVVEASNE